MFINILGLLVVLYCSLFMIAFFEIFHTCPRHVWHSSDKTKGLCHLSIGRPFMPQTALRTLLSFRRRRNLHTSITDLSYLPPPSLPVVVRQRYSYCTTFTRHLQSRVTQIHIVVPRLVFRFFRFSSHFLSFLCQHAFLVARCYRP